MAEVTRHFTATTFVVSEKKVLLHRHPKQGLWLPPGGHIERDELPHDAAVREVEEETGLRVHLHSELLAASMTEELDCAVVPQPAFILIEDINPFHQHIDFTYYAQVPSIGGVNFRGTPPWHTNGFTWFSPDDLPESDVPENVRMGAKHAVAYFEGHEKTR